MNLSRASVNRVIRTFVIAFLGILIPGLLDWLNELTKWAADDGQKAFPPLDNLTFVFVSALVAACIAVVNLVVVLIEDSTGKGFLRDVPPKTDES